MDISSFSLMPQSLVTLSSDPLSVDQIAELMLVRERAQNLKKDLETQAQANFLSSCQSLVQELSVYANIGYLDDYKTQNTTKSGSPLWRIYPSLWFDNQGYLFTFRPSLFSSAAKISMTWLSFGVSLLAGNALFSNPFWFQGFASLGFLVLYMAVLAVYIYKSHQFVPVKSATHPIIKQDMLPSLTLMLEKAKENIAKDKNVLAAQKNSCLILSLII